MQFRFFRVRRISANAECLARLHKIALDFELFFNLLDVGSALADQRGRHAGRLTDVDKNRSAALVPGDELHDGLDSRFDRRGRALHSEVLLLSIRRDLHLIFGFNLLQHALRLLTALALDRVGQGKVVLLQEWELHHSK